MYKVIALKLQKIESQAWSLMKEYSLTFAFQEKYCLNMLNNSWESDTFAHAGFRENRGSVRNVF